jgi:hypothetical protein
VKLQAESIRYCLQQAIEYRDAALASTFSRPTLVYYSITLRRNGRALRAVTAVF